MNIHPSMLNNNFLPFLKPINPPFVFQQSKPSILPKLRQALSLSLSRFMICELQKISQIQANATIQTKKTEISQNVIQILSSDEQISNHEPKLITRKIYNDVKNQIPIKQVEEKTDMSKDHFDCDKEQTVKSQQQLSNYVEKTHKIKKQNLNKIHLKLRKHKFSEIQEKLDLTETALIKNSPISAYEVNQKLQRLLQRRVMNWDETVRQKKERREIRMLQN